MSQPYVDITSWLKDVSQLETLCQQIRSRVHHVNCMVRLTGRCSCGLEGRFRCCIRDLQETLRKFSEGES